MDPKDEDSSEQFVFTIALFLACGIFNGVAWHWMNVGHMNVPVSKFIWSILYGVFAALAPAIPTSIFYAVFRRFSRQAGPFFRYIGALIYVLFDFSWLIFLLMAKKTT